ncbi:MAG: hypothetical protein ABR551_07225 [Gemmatimonadales bacterium]
MLPGRREALLALSLGLSTVSTAPAQTFGQRPVGFGGLEVREYRFDETFAVRSIRQVAIPLGATASFGRLSTDIGWYWAATTLTQPDGGYRRVTGPTDTQVRAAYAIGRDAAVASIVLNLPTGRDRMSPADFDVLGTASSSFLAFPVNAYAHGGSVTAALAGVLQAGAWNLGAAGSVRANRTFTPVVDPVAGPLNYRPGVEGRIRLGADRLVGASRIAAGLTLSGFRDDAYAGLGTVRGSYQPGRRWIGEVTWTGPFVGGMATGSVWGYRRSAGDTAGVSIQNAEGLAGISVTGSWVISPMADLEPSLEVRHADLQAGDGLLAGAGLGIRARVARRSSLLGAVRWERGFLDLQSVDDGGILSVVRTGLTSWHLSVFVRRSF